METRTLGHSDLQITPTGFGVWAIGGSGWELVANSVTKTQAAGQRASTIQP